MFTSDSSYNPFFLGVLMKSELCMKFCVLTPCLIIWLIIIFLYSSYNAFYIIPLINDSYWYDNNPNTQLTEEQFPFFRHIISLDSYVFQTNIENTDSNPKKGWILFGIMHYFLFWFIFSMLRTMFSDPGISPENESEWTVKTEKLANLLIEYVKKTQIGNKTLVVEKKSKKKSHFYSEKSSNIATPLKHPMQIEEDEFYSENKQGIQGVDPAHLSHKSEFSNYGSESEMINNEETNEQDLNREALDIVWNEGVFRYCKFCKRFKPLRTHHCRQCMRCVLKMDHHCQWVLNCIGLNNYKYFINMVIYANFTLFFMLLTFLKCVMDVALNPYVDGIVIYLILVSYVLAMVLFAIMVVFICFHFWLIYKGKTTLEFFEKDKNEDKNEKKNKKTINFISYDRGCYRNFVEVFNENLLLWFLPFSRNDENDGLYEEYEDKLLYKVYCKFSREI